MDDAFYIDTRKPFITSDVAAVTLAATNKALYPVANIPAMGKDYWWAGKQIRIRLFGRITTVLTPGNLTLSVLYGTGADANGVSLAASAAVALTASQTNLSWMMEVYIHCRSIGSAGTLFCDGWAKFNEAVIAAAMLIPASAPAVSGACDLTVANNIISVQALRSGSTAETMQVHDIDVLAMN